MAKTADSQDALATLREPFDPDQIDTVEKGGKQLSNVKPHHYIQRLIDGAIPYSITTLGAPQVHAFHDATVVTQGVRVTLHLPDDDYDFEGYGAEPIDGTDPDSYAFAFKSAASDALKIALKGAGVGLDLYKREVAEAKPARKAAVREDEEARPARQAAPAQRPTQNRSAWDGSKSFPFGKHKGKAYAELPDSFLNWAQENITDKPDIAKNIESELNRREVTGDSVADEPRSGGARKSPRRSGQVRESVDNF